MKSFVEWAVSGLIGLLVCATLFSTGARYERNKTVNSPIPVGVILVKQCGNNTGAIAVYEGKDIAWIHFTAAQDYYYSLLLSTAKRATILTVPCSARTGDMIARVN